MSPGTSILGVCDVSLGYGSGQIPAFILSLLKHYGTSRGIVIEPGDPDKHPKHDQFPQFEFYRAITAFNPYSTQGRIEYNLQAAKIVNKLRPEILVIFCTYAIPVLLKLKYRPKFVIYYSIESIPSYGQRDVAMNRYTAPLIDLVIFPEENRAMKDSERCGFKNIPKAILYNCSDLLRSDKSIIPPQERNDRIIYGGTIEKGRTFAEYFLRGEMQSIPVDLFGLVRGPDKQEVTRELFMRADSLRYHGYVDAEKLNSLRKIYSFSITMWKPVSENELYAAPNKFFESIADSVPPIAAPHPQCAMILKRYHCGILMDDWSFNSFYAAIQEALKIRSTDQYDKMVENCRKAFEQELNWEKQFAKVIPLLKEVG
jgi:glycosyltransferase involved in cell wall biosynthesis